MSTTYGCPGTNPPRSAVRSTAVALSPCGVRKRSGQSSVTVGAPDTWTPLAQVFAVGPVRARIVLPSQTVSRYHPPEVNWPERAVSTTALPLASVITETGFDGTVGSQGPERSVPT